MATKVRDKIYVRLGQVGNIELDTIEVVRVRDEVREEAKTLETVEKIRRIWFSPILDLASLRLYPYVKDHISFRDNYLKSIYSVLIVIAICACIFLQLVMLLAYAADMVYRPLLFISIHSNVTFFPESHNSSQWSRITVTTSSNRLYHMYEDWFLFAWDYLYGMIGLYSTVFLFMNAWNVDAEDFPGILKLINEIVKNKISVHNMRKPEEKYYTCCERFHIFISCSNSQMQSWLTKLGWGISHFLIIVLCVFLVVYWITVNSINWFHNSQPNQFLTQASSLSLALMIFDSIHWHLAPVIVCFLIRISCMEITTKLITLRYQFTKLVMDLERGEPNPDRNNFVLWREYYRLVKKTSAISKKYRRISAINIVVLIFSVVGISIHYLNNRIDLIDDFIEYDLIDGVRFVIWYCVHLFSVWAMVNEMAKLNLTLDHLPDEILVILATEGKITMDKEIKMQLKLCTNSSMRFSIDFFGVVNSTTVQMIVAFGSTTIGLFFTESLKILIENIKIKE